MSIRRSLNKWLGPRGYQIVKASAEPDRSRGFTLYTYLNKDGSFDYERYRKTQSEGNKQKIGRVWVQQESIDFLSRYIKDHLGAPKFGICHGTRRGLEQAWFAERLNCKVIGTEISDTATQFANTIQWDFHEVKPEWVGVVDFIYSNSFDHSYDPEKCLNAWMSCIKPGGFCIIEHSSDHGDAGATELDPFGAHLVQMPYLIALWGRGAYCVREILTAPGKRGQLEHLHFLVIYKFHNTQATGA